MKIKVMLALLFMHISAVAYGNDRFALETGLGVDYAGIGTQVYLPLGIDRVDMPFTPHRMWQILNAQRIAAE